VRAVMEMKDDGKFHALHHEVRDRLVAGKGSVFSQYLADALSADTLPTEISCALAWTVLGCFLDCVRGMGYSAEDMLGLVISMIQADDSQLEAMSKKMCADVRERFFCEGPQPSEALPLTALLRLRDLKDFETTDEIASVKACANSNHVQRQRLVRYGDEVLTIDPLSAAQKALQYLLRLPMSRLASAYPELVDLLSSRFELREETTVEDLIHMSGSLESKWIIHELLAGYIKHVSTLFVRYLDRNPMDGLQPESLYPLFLLAKHVCRERRTFTLKLQ
jgi:hypothetical protein